MKPIAVLGTGPAGLMAAYAVGITGQPLAVFGLGKKSRIGGAQFLHRPIPDLTADDPDFTVRFEVRGDAEHYQTKVYGRMPVPFVSFSGVHDGMEQEAWSLPRIYDTLWDLFGAESNQAMIDDSWLRENVDNFRAIVSTIPANAICENAAHRFTHGDILIAEMSMLEGRTGNTIVYDGTDERSWYRTSLINGVPGTEWGGHMANNPFKTVRVRKPIATNCDCHPEIIRAGRYGTWKKGVLAHDAFFNTLRELNECAIINIGPRQGPPIQQGLDL